MIGEFKAMLYAINQDEDSEEEKNFNDYPDLWGGKVRDKFRLKFVPKRDVPP